MSRHEQTERPSRARVSHSFRYAAMVEARFRVVSRSGDEFSCFCMWHDNDNTPSLQINVSSGFWLCFNPSCGAHGGPKTLIRFCGGRDSEDPEYDLAEVHARLDALTRQSGGEVQLRPVPEESLKRYTFPTDYWTAERGFTATTIRAFDLGYDPIQACPTIPIRNWHGHLLGVIRRDMNGTLGTKYKHPKGFKKKQELFASWLADKADTDMLVLTEGPLDAVMVWQAGFVACGQYGAMISHEQVRLIARMGFRRIVLFYDDDLAGHEAVQRSKGWIAHTGTGRNKKYSYDAALDLRRDFLVSEVHYDPGTTSDPGAMDSTEVASMIVAARRVV